MKKKNINPKSIKIISLGGLEHIGKNLTLFEYKDSIIIIDCGIMFPGDGMPGVDYIIPDFDYIKKHKNRVKGIIITHGHEDHIGAIPYLLQIIHVPIYATKLTIGLIVSRLEEKPSKQPPVFHEIKPRDTVSIGSFRIEFIKVNHSIIGGVALAINTDIGTIIHTGDFKIDFSPVDGQVIDLYRFADYGEKGVLLLLSDSTNAEREGFTKSESVLIQKLNEIFSESRGRIIVASFASNIHRIQQVIDAAQRYNRQITISGLTMQKNIEIARNLGFLNYRDNLIVDVNQANTLPHKKLVIIGTGSQGEPMSALSRMAKGTHRHFTAEKGDTVIITASVIPGNERMVNNVINSLMKLGSNVYYDQDEDIHVSGHGSIKELKLILSVTKPHFFMPIHGEYRHLKAHAKIAESLNIDPSRILIAQCGDVLALTSTSFKKVDSIDLSQIYIDGEDVGDIEGSVIKDRHAMSTDGIVIIIITIADGIPLRQPDIFTRGFLNNQEQTIITALQKDVNHRLKTLLNHGEGNQEIKNVISKGLRNIIFKLTKRNPLIVIEVLNV